MANETASGPSTAADSHPGNTDSTNGIGLHQNDEGSGYLPNLHSLFQQGSTSPQQEYQIQQSWSMEEPETSLHRKNTKKGSNTTSSMTGRTAFQLAATHPDNTNISVAIGSEGAGSLSHLYSLFHQEVASQQQEQQLPQQPARTEEPEASLLRKNMKKGSNTTSSVTERTSLLPSSVFKNNADNRDESLYVAVRTSTLASASYNSSSLSDLFQSPSSQKTIQTEPGGHKFSVALPIAGITQENRNSIYSIHEQPIHKETPTKNKKTTKQNFEQVCKEAAKETAAPATYIGGLMFVLYHLVFCLTSGSAIQRPHAKNSMLGLMTKMGALGIMFAAPVYLHNIGNDIPSMYPTCDLFLAPIFAAIAKTIDRDLSELTDLTDEENDEIFLATFGFLAFVGMGLAGCLLILAGVFKLANLGAFLPFPVLCGFFSAVAFRTWNLGFAVDTSGRSFRDVFSSGDTDLMLYALMHHIPGVIVALMMKYLGPKHPFSVLLVLFATIAAVYVVMFVTGTTLDEARTMGWFWHYEDMVYAKASTSYGFSAWLPPAPFGPLSGLLMGKIHWVSVWNGLPHACALSFLYLIRCALHSAALLKNVGNLTRNVKVVTAEAEPRNVTPRKKTRMELFSEIVDIEEIVSFGTGAPSKRISTTTIEVERAKPTTWTLQGVLIQYGIAQIVSACVGGFAVVPSVATSHAMFALRAERIGPQLLSVILVSGFYLTEFRLIAFVPKMAFSCLLSLAFIDNTLTWFIRSYFQTKSKQEWLAVPLIVLFAFAMGLLQAVFLGIAISTFLFVGAFFRSGVVKFAASGLTIRSTIERPPSHAQWLDEHGDLIQVVICQNYLFFGNASSIFSYISSMFEDIENDPVIDLPPIPQFVILDMVLVTGMDTSTVSIVSDILNLCQRHDCKLFLSGMSPELRSVLAHAGVKPLGGERSERKLRFFTTLDAAIGKAEDLLLECQFEEKPPSLRNLFSLGEESGFKFALARVDEQHGTIFARALADLEEHTVPIELAPGECLYDSLSRPERGLFFIEKGVMKIERDAGLTTNTRSLAGPASFGRMRGNIGNGGSISELRHRSGTIGRDYAKLKSTNMLRQQQNFRLARIGAGWVVGAVEAVSGLEKAGVHVAVSACRLHYISYCRMEQLEAEHPILMLHLYKLLSHIMAKQQELTIGQLGTLHAIMSSPAQTKHIGRRATLAFQQLQ